MRRFLIVVACIALVAGCGGGGGGGGSTPPTASPTTAPGTPKPPVPTASTSPAPGKTPTPGPSGKPSASPSTSPSTSPSAQPTGSPTSGPTSGPTTPPPTSPPTSPPPTTPPTSPPPTAPPTTAPTPTPSNVTPGWNGQNLSTQYEYTDSTGTTHGAVVNGTYGPAYTSNSTCPNGGYCGNYSGGGQGPVGSAVDGVSCEPTMSDNYHIHVFVGIYYNGQEIALPPATGMVNPTLDSFYDDMTTSGFYPCVYFTHTHDSTGVVHIESDNSGISETVPNDSKFNLGQYFAVWGVTMNCAMGTGCVGQFGPYSGPMEILTSGQKFRGDGTPGAPVTQEQDLTAWYGDPNTIPLYSHEVIWILIGPTYPSTLPGVSFDEQF